MSLAPDDPSTAEPHGDERHWPPVALRVPPDIVALLFDLDGVLTQTAEVHGVAWKEMSDAYPRERSARSGEPFRPSDLSSDYREHIVGKLRADGRWAAPVNR